MKRVNPSAPRQLPDEDLLELPKSWKQHTFDWPGRGAPRPVEIKEDAPAELNKRFTEGARYLEYAFRALPDPSLEAPIRAGIAGEPDPLGAALALKLLDWVDASRDNRELARDAWIAQYGIGFTVKAAVELLSTSVTWLHPRIVSRQQVRIGPMHIAHLAGTWGVASWISPIRSLLAALDSSAYAEVVASVGGMRSDDSKRFASAMLIPDQESWVEEACLLHASHGPLNVGKDALWSCVSRREHLEASGASMIDAYQCEVGTVVRLVDALGVEALPVLVKSLGSRSVKRPEVARAMVDALGILPSDPAIEYLLERSGEARPMAAARAAAKRFPVRTLRAIASVSEASTGPAKSRLAGISQSNALIQQAVAMLDEVDRQAIEQLQAMSAGVPVADPSTLPERFTSPPWAAFVNRATPTPLAGLSAPPLNELRWNEGEQEAFQVLADGENHVAHQGFWERSMPDGPRADHPWLPEFLAYASEELVGSALDQWDGGARSASVSTVKAILGRHSLAAIDRVMQNVRSKKDFRPAMLPIVNIDAARTAADSMTRSQSDRAVALAWLDRHPDAAAALLIPDAFGPDAKLRGPAVKALRYLAESNREILDTQANQYGVSAAEAVRALIEPDPFDPKLDSLPRIGTWADPHSLPQVLLAGGAAALPTDAVKTLMIALAIDGLEGPYRGVDVLVRECDAAGLTAFSWALYELWTAAGCPSKDVWAMTQLARFADERTVRRLAALICEWPAKGQSTKAVRGVEILGAIGTEAALWAVRGIAEETKFKALKKAAADQIDAIAQRLGLDREQLADRLVPDFGLDAATPLVLDYGPRSFTVKFDEQLRPYAVEDSGKRRANLPKPGAKDDLDLAQPAYERFTTMRKDLKKVAVEQVRRLESAMVHGRNWTGDEFQTYLVGHPLLWHLTGRLVWQADSGSGWTSFRLAEDRTLADLEDEPMALPGEAVVRLAHPATLGDEVEQWAAVLADYETLQPFDQLGRPALSLTEEERLSGRLSRFEGQAVDGGPLMGLLKRGWRYGDPDPRGSRRSIYFEFPEGGFIALETEPSFYPSYRPDDNLTLDHVELALPTPNHTIDAVAMSEALMAIAKVARNPQR
ncbi:DUF4132 domain-containing protein [Glycomyces lechevalierae]|uniref:DUF4132 domain-containing protein n=1 Tax=Glycomyces lechevalierae TaxID=256034 RepID=A0A9X3PLZ7_9ACTN|nr:DUF4132 domain-containing protein [Glycomyces lechevalierae]MDA1386246.1 DUF4132 domain-containing protein [Glycomyces lechevalierae]MDR7338280.1 hypothetical protein [Glycomyces lechevalierae]